MKIAISSEGRGLKSFVSSRFGRCSYFVIIEIENKKIKSTKNIKNTATAQFGGAGITAAQLIANEKANAVITVNLGPKAFQILNQLKIDMYQGQGKIADVVKKFIAGKLKKVKQATGPMYMGK